MLGLVVANVILGRMNSAIHKIDNITTSHKGLCLVWVPMFTCVKFSTQLEITQTHSIQ